MTDVWRFGLTERVALWALLFTQWITTMLVAQGFISEHGNLSVNGALWFEVATWLGIVILLGALIGAPLYRGAPEGYHRLKAWWHS